MRKLAVGALCLMTAGSAYAAVSQQQYDALVKQQKALQAQLKKVSQEVGALKTVTKKTVHEDSTVSIGPYLNAKTAYDGSDLLVTQHSVREAANLLRQRATTETNAKKAGDATPSYPRLTFSGYLETQASAVKPYTGATTTDLDLTAAELDTEVNVNPWVTAYMATDYDNSPGTPSRIDNSNVFLNRAFMTFGNFSKTPYYASFGQMYLPFGYYASNMVTAPVTELVGRVKSRAAEFGYQTTNFHAETYVAQGLSQKGKTKKLNEWGLDAGYRNNAVTFGTSYVANLADSQGFQGTVGQPAGLPKQDLQHTVPAVDVYGSYTLGNYSVLGEYLTATKQFADSDFDYRGKGAKPSAYNLEGAYSFSVFGKPSSFALGYGGSRQAVNLGVPEQRYSAVFNTSVWKDTLLSVEYRHDVNYGKNDVSTDMAADTKADLGKSDNAVTVQMDVYF